MICRKCADAAATYHLTEARSDGSSLELHLCDACARSLSLIGELTTTISGLLASLGAGPTPGNEGAFLVTPMDCQKCGRGHASIHLFEAFSGGERERHLCDRCGSFAAQVLESAFAGFPSLPATETRPVCPECGRIRFDHVKIGAQIRSNMQSAVLPIRILVRGCAWTPP
jgi:DNA-directed RNA polymerase subunit M/transcription elongation factor TFIIS